MSHLPARLADLNDRIHKQLSELCEYAELSEAHRRFAREMESRLQRAQDRVNALLKYQPLFQSLGAQLERDYEAIWISLSRYLARIDANMLRRVALARRDAMKEQ
jgi:hypothetical protein